MEGHVSGDRDEMLRRIKSAVSVVHAVDAAPLIPPDRSLFPSLLPFVGSSLQQKLSAFTARCEGLRTDVILVDRCAAFAKTIGSIVAGEPGDVAYHDHPLVTPAVGELNRPLVKLAVGYSTAELERCTFGVTACTALVAQTGSIMITSAGDGGRGLSIIAHHHIVVATVSQLVADLPTAYAMIDPAHASMMSLISGPSRTGDIERILVLGAHGPRKLSVVIAVAEEDRSSSVEG